MTGPAVGRATADDPILGRAGISPTHPQSGWHWVEWGAEFLGTGLLLLGGLSAVCLDFGSRSAVARAVPSHSARLLITGLLFAGTGSLMAISPWGRRSGAHLNPVVTLGFWLRGHVHPHDLAGYIVAQVLGAFAGTALVRLAWGHVALSVDLGVTQPGRGLNWLAAVGVETLMTAVLVSTIFAMVASAGRARWTPLVLWPVIATLVWQGAPYTGTSLNPARSLAPAALLPHWTYYEVYVAGPVLGSLVAVALFAVLPDVEAVTAKLYHDTRYRSTLRSSLPVRGAATQ